ncbi:exodeoxyribonuclease 7 large subunit [Clostridium sp. CAG:628]|nr:exodeoxyribonuclease 7 large subunit [Clostridium sp. CAG:628]
MNNEVSLTVTDINNYIKNIVDGDFFLSNVTLKGEISNLKFHTRGHLYFSLKDENSKINAVMFNYKNLGLNFIPKDGMNVIVKGKVSVFTTGGSYQITVSNMKEDGIGNLYILFEELKRRLEREGLFSPEHKKKLPRIPKKVGVITASTGAAVKDIISTINRRFPLTEIILFPTLVQGVGAKENIVKMINEANESDVDVIILGRGGGSIDRRKLVVGKK